MAKYRKKPVVIDAWQWMEGKLLAEEAPDWLAKAGRERRVIFGSGPCLAIETLEGTMMARPGDWIIQGVKGEKYPCKPDIFEETYEPVLENE